MDRFLPPLFLALLFALAGCNVAEAPADGDVVSVSVSNEANRTHDVWITVAAEPIEAVEVTYQNGTTHQFPVYGLDTLAPDRLDGATNVTIVAETVQNHRYTVAPNTGIGETYADVPANPVVVDFVRARGGDDVGSMGAAKCGGGSGVTDLIITIRPDGSTAVETTCADPPSTADSPG
jgi:hypothetical protein